MLRKYSNHLRFGRRSRDHRRVSGPRKGRGMPNRGVVSSAAPVLWENPVLALGHVTAATCVQIVNGPTTHAPGCPSRSPACLDRAEYAHYFLPGDQVIISARHGTFNCATNITATGSAQSGWLPADAVAPDQAEPVAPADDWLGHWHHSYAPTSTKWRAESDITVKAEKAGALWIESAAKDPDMSDGAIKRDAFDLLDAIACAAIARRIVAGQAMPFLDPPLRDELGLPVGNLSVKCVFPD
jgi:hypothetical protein